jgi:ATP-dependent protease ClpP protease subunit
MRALVFMFILVISPAWALTVILPEEITDETMAPLISQMKSSNKHEVLTIIADSRGGQLSAMEDFLAVASQFSFVVSEVYSEAASAAAIIAASSDEVHVYAGGVVLFHRAHCGESVKCSDEELDDMNIEVRESYELLGFNQESNVIMFDAHKDFAIRFETDTVVTGRDLVQVFNLVAKLVDGTVKPSRAQELLFFSTRVDGVIKAMFDADIELARTNVEKRKLLYILTGMYDIFWIKLPS